MKGGKLCYLVDIIIHLSANGQDFYPIWPESNLRGEIAKNERECGKWTRNYQYQQNHDSKQHDAHKEAAHFFSMI